MHILGRIKILRKNKLSLKAEFQSNFVVVKASSGSRLKEMKESLKLMKIMKIMQIMKIKIKSSIVKK